MTPGVAVESHGELSLLDAEVRAAASLAGTQVAPEGGIETVRRSGSARRFLVYDKVEHSADTLGVVLHAGIGYDLYFLYGRCRHHLEYRRGVGRKHRIMLSVHGHYKRRAPVDGDIVLRVNRHHGDLSEHVQNGGRLGVDILGDIIGHLVDVHLDKGTLGGYRSARKCLHIVLDKNLSKVLFAFALDEAEIPPYGPAAYIAEHKGVIPCPADGVDKVSVLVGRSERYGFGTV